jgi:hypothetical protein
MVANLEETADCKGNWIKASVASDGKFTVTNGDSVNLVQPATFRGLLRVESGAPGGTRTPGLLIRSQSLYPAELRARVASSYHHKIGDRN